MDRRNTKRKKYSNKKVILYTAITVLFSLFLFVGEKYNLVDTNQILSAIYGVDNELVNEINASEHVEKGLALTEINEQDENLINIYFFDQTTTNMILIIKSLFVGKPLISIGI